MGITISHRVRTDNCEAARVNSRRFLMEQDATVAKAGKRQTYKTTNMNKDSRPLTQEQRKEFIQLLKDSKTRLLGNLQDAYWKRIEVAKEQSRMELLKRIGAADEANKLREAKKVIKESESALDKLGVFINSSNRITFTGVHEDEYDEEISEKASAILDSEKEKVRKEYETAILNVLSTESVDDAKTIVEPLV